MANGIDVSNNNGHVDWAAVAASGVKYAIAKATEGLGFVDAFYTANRSGAAAHGIAFGAYHFFTPGADSAAQARFFLQHATPKKGDIVPTLDYEHMPATAAPAEAFVKEIHAATGHFPMFYSYLSFIGQMRVAASSPLASCPLWMADFTSAKPAPPNPWKEITIWQHSSSGSVPGIGGRVDLDVGTPPTGGPVVPPPPKEWTVDYHGKLGKAIHVVTKHPARWQLAHPKAKFNGRITITPVHPK